MIAPTLKKDPIPGEIFLSVASLFSYPKNKKKQLASL
jgi:hypothetical protein